MPDTTNYEWALPTIGADFDTWGNLLNAAFDDIDAQVFTIASSIATAVDTKLDKAGGTLTGALNGTAATFSGNVTASTFIGALTGNASTATTAARWTTARTLTLSGPVTGSISLDGSANGTLTTSIADGALSIAKVSGLTTALAGKEPTQTAEQRVKIYIGDTAPANSFGADGDVHFEYV